MNGEQGKDGVFLLTPTMPGTDPDAVTPALTAAFLALRDALEAGRPAVIVVPAPDLLGRGTPSDAAVATGLLGMMRTLAIEGRRSGRRVNMVAAAGEDEEGGEAELSEAVAMLAASSLSGRLLQLGGADLGKVVP